MQAISNAVEGEISANVHELHQVPSLLFRPEQPQFLIRCHQPLCFEAQTKDSVLGLVNYHMCIRGNQGAESFPKVGAKQYANTCLSLIDW